MNPNSTEDVSRLSNIANSKKIACRSCRKRKARCDGGRPACALCLHLGVSCYYDSNRKRSGPKAGRMKEIQSRLLRLEESRLLEEHSAKSSGAPLDSRSRPDYNKVPTQDLSANMWHLEEAKNTTAFEPATQSSIEDTTNEPLSAPPISHLPVSVGDDLPSDSFIKELEQSYFAMSNTLFPLVHFRRYNEGLYNVGRTEPPLYLRYAIWSIGALNLGKYGSEAETFYLRCRNILEYTEVHDTQQRFWTVACVQTWSLIAIYEFRMMYFARAWMSGGRGGRLATMLTFNKLDRGDMNFKQGLAPPTDPVELEERRRALWAVYQIDKFAGVGTSYTSFFNDEDMHTNLPCPEEAWQSGIDVETCTLSQGLAGKDVRLSPFSLLVLCAAIWSKHMAHVHRAREEDVLSFDGPWWMRHRELDQYLRALELRISSHQYPYPASAELNLANCTLQG